MTVEDWERIAAAAVPVLAVMLAPVGAVVVGVMSARATKSAARIARDQDREADVRRRRVDAYGKLAHACRSTVESMHAFGDWYVRIVERETRHAETTASMRNDEQENRQTQVEEAEAAAATVWDEMWDARELRARLLDVQLVGPASVTAAADAYVETIIAVQKEIAEDNPRSLLAADMLTAPRVEKDRAAMHAAMLAATVNDTTD